MYTNELFRLQKADIERLERSGDAADICTLGKWYIFTAPADDYVARAEGCFRRAIELGDAEAKLHLANMYRLGDFGKVDMDEYHRLLGESEAAGCQLAAMRRCKDIAYGVDQQEDVERGLEEAMRTMGRYEKPDAMWYDVVGCMLVTMGKGSVASDWFRKAIAAGYVDSYLGLADNMLTYEEGRKAGCGGCCVLIAEQLKVDYDENAMSDANAVECFSDDDQKRAYLVANSNYRNELAERIEALYMEAAALGESAAYYYLGMLYFKAQYNHLEDDEKAWTYFMRGAQLGHLLCFSMLAEMTEEGYAPDEYGWEEACLFRLKALRLGDDDQLLPVMQAYFEGDLDEHKDEIERCYRAKYEALGEDGIDDDPEDDDGRYDAWA